MVSYERKIAFFREKCASNFRRDRIRFNNAPVRRARVRSNLLAIGCGFSKQFIRNSSLNQIERAIRSGAHRLFQSLPDNRESLERQGIRNPQGWEQTAPIIQEVENTFHIVVTCRLETAN